MNEIALLEPARTASPRSIARLIGVFTLLTVIGGVYAQGFVSKGLVVWGDPGATASRFLAARNLAQSALAVYLIEMACSVVTTALFYVLLKPAGGVLSLTAAGLGLVGCCVKTVARVFFAAPLYVLGGTYAHALRPEALKDLALVFLMINDHAAGIAMVFFGFYALLTGALIVRSTFLPRFLGLLSMLGGVGWLTILWPALWHRLGGYVLLVALVGAAATAFWLLVFGVNEERWHEQAGSSPVVRSAREPSRRVG